MKDNTTPKKIMRRRGRPRKSSSDNSPIRKTRTLRLTEEEVRHITENARRCRKNFSEYCRQVLMGYKPGVPDPELRDGLLASRKDIVNFINNISGLNMTREERSRAIAHGNAYTTYSTLKRDAEYVCSENMAGDMTVAVTEDDLDCIWMQFKYAGENYISTGKPVTRNLIAMEVSPAKEESKGWTLEQWSLFAHRFVEEMDKIEFRNKEAKVLSKRTDFAHSKWLAMLHHDAKSGIPHLHFMVSRFTVDGRINDTNLIGLKATMAANSINQSMGWRQSQDISEEHKAEIKNALYDILRSMERFDWDVYLRKIREHGYSAELRRDSKGNVVGYRIMRGNSR